MNKVIDIHSHLGDIFAYQKNVTFSLGQKFPSNLYNPFDAYSKKGFTGAFLDPSNPKEVENVIEATAYASWCNTLENLTKDLDENGITYVCEYPILPFIGFEEYLAASKLESRIIPFTSADWSQSEEKIGKKLLQDVELGAKGLKIHPIIQSIDLKNPKVSQVLNKYWVTTGLPVVSHCGVNSYYPSDSKEVATQSPEFGDPNDFIYLYKKCPDVIFIAAHAGGLTGGEMENLYEQLGRRDNLYVDTTFRSSVEMQKLVEFFGEDNVLWGSDVPFGRRDCSLKAAKEAFGENSPIYKKVTYSNAEKLLKLV